MNTSSQSKFTPNLLFPGGTCKYSVTVGTSSEKREFPCHVEWICKDQTRFALEALITREKTKDNKE